MKRDRSPKHPCRQNRPARVLAALAISCCLLATPVMTAAQSTAASASFAVAIAAGPFEEVLNNFAVQTGLTLSFAPELVEEMESDGLQGNYTIDQGLEKLLYEQGLQAIRQENGSYAIQRASSSSKTEETNELPPMEVTAEAETANGPVYGYVAKQSATATKTDTPLIETPQSISVVTADQMAAVKAQSLSSALTYTPGISSQSGIFTRMVDDIMLRGFNAAAGNSGMLRDGMKLQSNVYDGGQEIYGLERLEVLRGPASILYGQLSPGGAVNAVSKRPTATTLGEVNLEYGSFAHKQASFDFGGPIKISDKLTFRLTGLLRDAENQVDHVNDDKRYFAPALSYRFSENTSLTLLASYQEVRTKFAPPLTYESVADKIVPDDLFIGEPDYDRYESDISTIGYEFEHKFNKNLKLSQKLRHFHADVIWDYLSFLSLNGSTLSRYPSDRTETSNGLTSDTSLQWTRQAGSIEQTFLAGLDYYQNDYDRERYFGTADALTDIYNPVYGGSVLVDTGTDYGFKQEGTQTGLYVQEQAKISNHYVVVLGGRYDWIDFEQTAAASGSKTTQDDEAFTGRVGLVYLAGNGLAPYASFSQSFAPTTGSDADGNPFDPTEGEQFEVGIRYQPKHINLMLSVAAFELTETNVLTQDGTETKQTGEVRSRGFELEARGSLTCLDLVAAYTYIDARVTKSKEADEQNQRVALVPYHALSIWVDYDCNHIGLPGLSLGAGTQYHGSTNIPGYDHDVPDYTLVDARVSLDLGAFNKTFAGTSIAFNAGNLLDEDYYTCVSDDGCRYGSRRSFKATLSYRW